MRRAATRRGLRSAGMSLVEAVIASTCTLALLGVAIPAFTSASDAGDQGAARVRVQSDTRHALLRIAREMENASTTAVNGGGAPRLTIVDGLDPSPMVACTLDNGDADMGGFEGVLGTEGNTSNSVADNDTDDRVNGTTPTGTVNSNEAGAMGTGARGGSQWGRQRSSSWNGTTEFGRNSLRPRHAVIPKNSILTFQKVAGYTVDSSGAPVVTWTTPITYRVDNRKLVRVQDGNSAVICPVCVGFQAQLSDVGTVVITIVSQARAHTKAGIVAEANQIEVSPKN